MEQRRYHRLKEVRLELGIPQVELARRLGVKPPHLATWEDARGDAKISTLLRWADALGVEPARLLVWPRRAGKVKRK
jgi:transcriptional regulator with XRE-family HTH domain